MLKYVETKMHRQQSDLILRESSVTELRFSPVRSRSLR